MEFKKENFGSRVTQFRKSMDQVELLIGKESVADQMVMFEPETTKIEKTIDQYFSGPQRYSQQIGETGNVGKGNVVMASHVQFYKSQREKDLFSDTPREKNTQSRVDKFRQRNQPLQGNFDVQGKNNAAIKRAYYNQGSFSSSDDDTSFKMTPRRNQKGLGGEYKEHEGATQNAYIDKIRKSVMFQTKHDQEKEQLKGEFKGISLNELIHTEKDTIHSKNQKKFAQKRIKQRKTLNKSETSQRQKQRATKSQEREKEPADEIAIALTDRNKIGHRGSSHYGSRPQNAGEQGAVTFADQQVRPKGGRILSQEQRFRGKNDSQMIQSQRFISLPQTDQNDKKNPFNLVKESVNGEYDNLEKRKKLVGSQRFHSNASHDLNNVLKQTETNPNSQYLSNQNLPKLIQKKTQHTKSLTLSKLNSQNNSKYLARLRDSTAKTPAQGRRRNLFSGTMREPMQSYPSIKKTSKATSHLSKVQSSLEILKKKIEIFDDQNRLGPSNQIHMPDTNELYFKAAPNLLVLEGNLPSDGSGEQNAESNDSDTSSSDGYSRGFKRRPKKASHSPSRDSSQRKKGGQLKPQKEFKSQINQIIKRSRHNGKDQSDKFFEREAAAKYIYNKYGQHLMTYNFQTRNEVIPMLGEHIRRTTETAHKEDKQLLLNRKNSSIRSHFVGLKKDLQQKNLPVPRVLNQAQQERFVRNPNQYGGAEMNCTTAQRDTNGFNSNGSFDATDQMMFSPSPPERRWKTTVSPRRYDLLLNQQNVQNSTAQQQQQPQSQQAMRQLNVQKYAEYIKEYKPKTFTVDKDMDNLEFQRNSLRVPEVKALYDAKCADLDIRKDDVQFQNFMRHVISKAKNRSLDLSSCNLGFSSARVLAHSIILNNENFSRFNLGFNNFGEEGVDVLMRALEISTHVVSIDLGMNDICQEGAKYVARALLRNQSLIQLSLSSGQKAGNNRNRIMERGAYFLSRALEVNKYLLILDIAGNSIGNEGLFYLLPAITHNKTLQSLNIGSNEISSGNFRVTLFPDRQNQLSRLSHFIDPQEIQKAALEQSALEKVKDDDNEMKKLMDAEKERIDRQKYKTAYLIRDFLIKAKQLKVLDLRHNNLGDKGIQIISQAFEGILSQVESLNLAQTEMTTDGARELFTCIRRNHRMTHLTVDNNNMHSHYNFSAVEQMIAGNSTLQYFSAQNCNLSDQFGVPFSIGLRSNKTLLKFNMKNNQIGARSLITLATSINQGNQRLREFDLSRNCIDDIGGLKLPEMLLKNDQLLKINLQDNQLTDESAQVIIRALKLNKKVQEIKIGKNLINFDLIEKIDSHLLSNRELKNNNEVLTCRSDVSKLKNVSGQQRKIENELDKEEKDFAVQQERKEKLLVKYRQDKEVSEHKLDYYEHEYAALKRLYKDVNEQLQNVVHRAHLIIEDFDIQENVLIKKFETMQADQSAIRHEIGLQMHRKSMTETENDIKLGVVFKELREAQHREDMAQKYLEKAQKDLQKYQKQIGSAGEQHSNKKKKASANRTNEQQQMGPPGQLQQSWQQQSNEKTKKLAVSASSGQILSPKSSNEQRSKGADNKIIRLKPTSTASIGSQNANQLKKSSTTKLLLSSSKRQNDNKSRTSGKNGKLESVVPKGILMRGKMSNQNSKKTTAFKE